jgi:hypothetical protein
MMCEHLGKRLSVSPSSTGTPSGMRVASRFPCQCRGRLECPRVNHALRVEVKQILATARSWLGTSTAARMAESRRATAARAVRAALDTEADRRRRPGVVLLMRFTRHTQHLATGRRPREPFSLIRA